MRSEQVLRALGSCSGGSEVTSREIVPHSRCGTTLAIARSAPPVSLPCLDAYGRELVDIDVMDRTVSEGASGLPEAEGATRRPNHRR